VTLDRRSIAIHEAGHAVAYVVLGRPIEYVTVRPVAGSLAYCQPGPVELPSVEGFDASDVVPMKPPAMRAWLEVSAIIALAGPVAADALTAPTHGYLEPEAPPAAVRDLDDLPPRVAELMAAADADGVHGRTDEQRAEMAVRDLAGAAVSPFYLEWLRDEARTLVRCYADAIVRVADALERSDTLTAAEIAALVHPQGAVTGPATGA
jgi:hypothetical protein